MSKDLKDTVFLPKTDFPMRGNLPTREPEMFARWEEEKVYETLRTRRKGRPTYIVHDGPPFANGHVHMGHALNRIIKDVVVRGQSMMGKDVPFVPGWDCHGLPIEWKIEEQYRAQGKSKQDVDPKTFREECAVFAQHWMDTQIQELKRLGLSADWKQPYKTMNPASEAVILKQLGQFLMDRSLYKGFRPVMWSVVEQTALAEAEVEYKEHTSSSIYVGFPITNTTVEGIEQAKMVIWTTTPWTLPANRAIAYNEDIKYVHIRSEVLGEKSIVSLNAEFVVAQERCADFCQAVGIERHTVISRFRGEALAETVCRHPLRDMGYGFDVPLLPGEHVTTEAGTGLVHTAPSHGPEDFVLGKIYGLDVPETVAEDGTYTKHVPGFKGKHIFKVDHDILDALRGRGALLGASKLVHSYPHSWRSKAPLIYRATPQWFIDLDDSGLRTKALKAIKDVKWVPANSERRITGMVEGRPDWCITRQRTWGIPMTVFVHKETGEPLRDQKIHDRIVAAVAKHGCDVWYTSDAADFLGSDYDANDYDKVTDILDVWFESGSTHAFVLQENPDLEWPADLYIEGSDQHRGWFQSSLLIGAATKGKAPYKSVMTHGFILDQNRQKMSKSGTNAVSPLKIADEMGIEMLRLWVVNSDVSDDIAFGKDILGHQKDIYRRFRNTIRYLLGALNGYDLNADIAYKNLSPLEKWVLHRVAELNAQVKEHIEKCDLMNLYNLIHNFCAVDLSSFYFDVRKDSLYCDAADNPKRQGCLFVMHYVLDNLLRWLAPVLVFTSDEAWRTWKPSAESIHLAEFNDLPKAWINSSLVEKMEAMRHVRRVVTGAIEKARSAGELGSSLQAHVDLYTTAKDMDFPSEEWAELSIISTFAHHASEAPEGAFTLDDVPGIGVVVRVAPGGKCERCWRVLEEVNQHPGRDHVCNRCEGVVNSLA
jgi:isoleucyl-tRNA synthetase